MHPPFVIFCKYIVTQSPLAGHVRMVPALLHNQNLCGFLSSIPQHVIANKELASVDVVLSYSSVRGPCFGCVEQGRTECHGLSSFPSAQRTPKPLSILTPVSS
jgi:hypothetical protein